MSPASAQQAVAAETQRVEVLRRPAPGPLWPWVKRASWFELAIFTLLIVFWLLPGFDRETFIFGLSHGIGYIALCILIWIAVLQLMFAMRDRGPLIQPPPEGTGGPAASALPEAQPAPAR